MKVFRNVATAVILVMLLGSGWAANKQRPDSRTPKNHTVESASTRDQRVATRSTGELLASRGASATPDQVSPLDASPLGQPPTSSGDQAPTHMNSTVTYTIPWYSINAGGGPSSSTSYQVNASVGQSTIGEASSPNYGVGAGYMYGATASPPPCACDCQGDQECNGLPTVFDVVFVVGEAFRNEPFTLDPNALCPLVSMNDLNYDDVVNVFDVVFVVNMAFRNRLREDNVCDPCTEIGPPSCPF